MTESLDAISQRIADAFTKFKPVVDRELNNESFIGTQKIYVFENGYGASVIRNFRGLGSYGHEAWLWELSVEHGFTDRLLDGDGCLTSKGCYETPITNDVLGWLSWSDVEQVLLAIAKLPVNDDCVHYRIWDEELKS